MKTLIAVPCMDSVASGFAQSLATLGKIGECSVAFQIGSLVYESRNELAKKAIKSGADYVLWLDSDMIFNPDTMERLMKHMEDGLDFVSGLYFRRVSPFTPVIFEHLNITDDDHAEWINFDKYPRNSLFEIEGCGFGCVLMRTQMLLDVMAENDGKCFNPLAALGEDLAFCMRARESGYKLYCDSSIQCGHYAHLLITEAFYDSIGGNENEG